MTAAHTARGKETERMAARWFRANGYPGCERTVRTGYRTPARELADHADLDLCPGLIAQVKSLRPANRAERAVTGWMRETEVQRDVCGADVGLLVVRREGTADVGEWWAWLWLDDAAALHTGGLYTSLYQIPVRLLLSDAVTLLRHAGYGTPPDGAA
jgi:hypothetical protein